MSWPPKDWRALIALLGSILGAASLTVLLWWGLNALLPARDGWTTATEAHRAGTIRVALWIVAGTIAIVIISLGFAVNRRSFKATLGNKASIDFEGGENEQPREIELPHPNFSRGG